MSEASTGVAQAKARVSTMPKLSPPSDGATSAFVEHRRAVSSVLREEADDVDPLVGDVEAREEEPDGERIGARDDEAGARPAADLGPGAEQHLQALARLMAAGEDDRVLALTGIRVVGDQDAVRHHLPRPARPTGRPRRAPARRRRSSGRRDP